MQRNGECVLGVCMCLDPKNREVFRGMKKQIQLYYDPEDEMYRTLIAAKNKTYLLEVCYKFSVEFYKRQTKVRDPDSEDVIYYLIAMMYLLKQGRPLSEIVQERNAGFEDAAEQRRGLYGDGKGMAAGFNLVGGYQAKSAESVDKENKDSEGDRAEGMLMRDNPALASVMADVEIQ